MEGQKTTWIFEKGENNSEEHGFPSLLLQQHEKLKNDIFLLAPFYSKVKGIIDLSIYGHFKACNERFSWKSSEKTSPALHLGKDHLLVNPVKTENAHHYFQKR